MAFDPLGSVSILDLEAVDSTNAEALRRARAGERGPLWIVAREQQAGRGRRGRPWISSKGNLHATLMLTDPAPAAVSPQLGFVAGLALHDAAAVAAPSLATCFALKWPNDLLCRGRKIAGILIEGEGHPITVAIGIGVNCRCHPEVADFPATDFAAEGADVDTAELINRLAAAMQARLTQWNRGTGFASIRAAWLSRAHGLTQPIRVQLAERETTGLFETIDDAGRLIVRIENGGLVPIAAGAVFPLNQIA
jgi:BirA family transcriptional regulator, biotin operon repressor / biotin---[acetyl-CoA-carboxylase] ligase